MPAFLVELAENEKATLSGNRLGKVVVWAGTAADAKDVAKTQAEGDSNAAWEAATVTDLSTVQNFAHMTLFLSIPDAPTPVSIDLPMPTGNVVESVVITDGGSAYEVGDIITVATGTATRACTLRVTTENTNIITGLEIVDPGDNYTIDPDAAGATTGHTADATVTVVMVANDYKNLIGGMVTLLNADAQIAGAAFDLTDVSGGTLIAAVGSGGDDLGDKILTAKFYITADPAKQAIDGMLGTVTDGGSSTDDLKVLGQATQVSGKLLATL